MKAIIVEDEENGRIALKNLIENYCPKITQLNLAKNVSEAIELINKERPQVLFLDIELPDGTGFNILEQIPKYNYTIIFITAYSHFAQKAIKYSAIDYLLKPYDPLDVLKAVENADIELGKTDLQLKVATLLENNKQICKIALPSQSGLLIKCIDDITYLESNNNYTFFNFNADKQILITKTLKHFEDLLSGNNFIRTHQKFLVNINFIEQYVKGEGGYVIINNKEIPVSRRKKDELLEKLKRVFL